MTELIPRLFIGNWQEASNNADKMHVVTVAIDSPFVGHKKFDLIDGPGNSPELVVEAANYVTEIYEKGENVLVHCVGGRSRSGLVNVLAIMKITGKNLCEVYDDAANKHPHLRIHPYLSKILLGLTEF